MGRDSRPATAVLFDVLKSAREDRPSPGYGATGACLTEKPNYGNLIFTVAANFKSRQAQSQDCGCGFVE